MNIFNRLNFWKAKSINEILPQKRTLYFNEDEYCQQQLVPLHLLDKIQNELTKVNNYSQEHLAPNGVGWTEMYILEDYTDSIKNLKILAPALKAKLVEIASVFDSVTTGYSSMVSECNRTAAVGNSTSCALYYDWDENDHVNSIWTGFFNGSVESLQESTELVKAVSEIHPMIYVDWAWGYVCNASDPITFKELLTQKLNEINKRTNWK